MTELQAFSPARIDNSESGSEFVPLEILLDSGSKTEDFERIVPQTDVSLQYDKFNRLRLRTKTQGGTLSQRRESTHDEHLKHHMVCPRSKTHTSVLFFDCLTIETLHDTHSRIL
jgi:hypothetical protein